MKLKIKYNNLKDVITDTYKENNEFLQEILDDLNNTYVESENDVYMDMGKEEINSLVNDIYDDLCDDDSIYQDNDKEANKYYLGSIYKEILNTFSEKSYIVIHNSFSRKFLMSYNYNTLNFYLCYSRYMSPYNNYFNKKKSNNSYVSNMEKIEIIKTGEDYEETGSIIIKTFWLKMVQRSWKKTYKQRLEWIKKNYSIQGLRFREINGRNKYGHIPTIRGMLSHLKN